MRARTSDSGHWETLIVPSIQGCTMQTKLSFVPLAAVTLNVTLPFGGLFGSGNVREQVPGVREDLEAITAQCKTALAGT